MLPPDQSESKSASGSSTDIFTIEELDSNSFNLFETNSSIEIQPDLSSELTASGTQNSQGNHWFHHLDGPGYRYINRDGTRYYEYSDKSNIYCDPHHEGLVRYREVSPTGVIEKELEVRGKGSILLVTKRSNAGLTVHVYSPLPLGRSQSDIYRTYVSASESNQNL